jgi:hypothetical protein
LQLACQRNSLNRRSITLQEIAEPSEILTLQKTARVPVTSSAEVTQEGGRSEALRWMQESRYES